MKNHLMMADIRRCQRALEREVEIEAFEEWQRTREHIDPIVLEKLARELSLK